GFGADPNIDNKTNSTNGTTRTIIGVMPPEFNYPKGAEIYSPLAITPELARSRLNQSYLGIGRLKPAVSIQAAQADMDHIAGQLEQQYPASNTRRGVVIYPILKVTVHDYTMAVWVTMAALGVVLPSRA